MINSFQLTLIINFFLISTFTLLIYQKQKTIFSLGVIFNSYAFLYFIIGPLLYEIETSKGGANIDLGNISELVIYAMLSFNLTYFFLTKERNVNEKLINYKKPPTMQSIIFILLVGVIAKTYLIVDVGVGHFFFSDRIERFETLKNNRPLFLLSKVTDIALIFFFIRYFAFRKKVDKFLLLFLISYNLAFAIITISRSELAFNFLIITFFLHSENIVSKAKIIILACLMAILMFSYKGILYFYILGDANYGTYNPGEFINWIRNSILLIKGDFNSEDLPNNSYLLAFKSMFFIDPGGDALSEWFIKKFYPERYSPGLTYGFSGLIEGYLYLGIPGIIFHFSFIAIIFAYLENSRNPFRVALTICAMFIMFRLFRSEIYNFTRTYTWYYLYPIFLIGVSDIILRKIAKKRISYSMKNHSSQGQITKS